MAYEAGLGTNFLKDFSVDIDGVALTAAQTKEINMHWSLDGLKILGKLIFHDLSNLIEDSPIRGNNKVKIKLTDNDDESMTQNFTVTDVKYTRDSAGYPLVALELVDETTMKAMQMYNEMSWKKADIIEIIDHPETMKPLMSHKKTDFFSPTGPKHENFVMPLHVSFNTVSHWLAKNNNVMWYQTRTDFVIQPVKVLFGRSKKGDKYRYKTSNNHYRRKISEYEAHFGKLVEANAFQPNAKVASFDPLNKHAKWEKADFKGAIDKLNSPGNTALDLPGTGDRHYYKTDYHIKKNVEMMWGKNSYKNIQLQLLVPGQFSTNIGDIIELDLVNYIRPTLPEKNINGLWLIQEITDIIAGPEFIQKLVLVRSRFST